MAKKWNYTPEQSHQVKNLKVSNNILKKDIEKLEASKAGLDEAAVAAIDTKIAYKTNRIAEKAAKIEEIQAAAGMVEIVKPVAPATEVVAPVAEAAAETAQETV